MKHLLDIQQLSQQEITALIQRAIQFKNHPIYPKYSHVTLANLFYENSTRTRVSFELAANALGMPVVNMDMQRSSESKGELIGDTFQTLAAMGIKLFVIRHAHNGIPAEIAEKYGNDIHIVNAGDGQHAHPSQALLDMMTIFEQKPDFAQLKIAIVGNIRHSRVANSLQCICAKLGVGELRLVSPTIWQPKTVHFGRVTTSLQDGITDADVVICLRVQTERLNANEFMDLEHYRAEYALTCTSLAWAKPDAMVMHPGPINRGVEIDSEIADGPQSYILHQVRNGVYMRMALLESLLPLVGEGARRADEGI